MFRNPVKKGFNLSETWRYQFDLVAKFKNQAIISL